MASSTGIVVNSLFYFIEGSTASFQNKHLQQESSHQKPQSLNSLPQLTHHKLYTKETPSLVRTDPLAADSDHIKLIINESRRFCSTLSSSIERKPLLECSRALSNKIEEILQAPVPVNPSKIRHVVGMLVSDESFLGLMGNDEKSPFYMSCLSEACVQICSSRPVMLTRQSELICYAQKILENLFRFSENRLRTKR